MTWEERAISVAIQGEVLTSRVRFKTGDICHVEVTCRDLAFVGDGPDLFAALGSARRELEAHAYQLMCNGSRRDVYPSPMQRQALSGRRAYVLTLPRSLDKPATVDIFGEVSDLATLASVDEQRAWFDHWRQTGPESEGRS